MAASSQILLFLIFRMIDFWHSVLYEGAREKMPMASVDDPGEYFVPAGQEKQVKWLIPKNQQCLRPISDGRSSWGRVGDE